MNELLFLFCLCPVLYISAQNNPLPDCPQSPNCFRSEVDSKRAAKQAFSYKGDIAEAKQLLIKLFSAYPGAKHKATEKEKVSFEFTTKLGKFTDDVEFYFDDQKKQIHFRSASQVGWSDMGANKRRIKKLRKIWSSNCCN